MAMRVWSAVLLVALLLPTYAASGAVITLNCRIRMNVGNQEEDRLLYVDADAGTVNGIPAIVNEDSIFWPVFSDEIVLEHHINRFTGSIVIDLIRTKTASGVSSQREITHSCARPACASWRREAGFSRASTITAWAEPSCGATSESCRESAWPRKRIPASTSKPGESRPSP